MPPVEDDTTNNQQGSPAAPDGPAMLPSTPDDPPSANPFIEEWVRVSTAARAAAIDPDRDVKVHRGPFAPAPVIESPTSPGRPHRTWPWVLVIVVALVLIGAGYVTITKYTAAGPRIGVVPEIVGLSETKAVEALQEAGFRSINKGIQASTQVPPGVVAKQDPQQGKEVAIGETVRYWVSPDTGMAYVPDVVGMDRESAVAELTTAGFEVVFNSEVNGSQAAGTVLRQAPEASRQVEPGATVTITLAAATDTVKVPLLIGMDETSALAALSALHLGANLKQVSSQSPAGSVVGQSPKAGSEVQPGTTVTVEVSNSPESSTIMVPPVAALGLTEAQARARLARYGLKARVVSQETPDFKPGLCIYQSPAAGARVKIGSTVRIYISRKPTTTTVRPTN